MPRQDENMGIYLAVVYVFAATIYGVASYTLTISPDYVKVSQTPQTITFTCTADIALTGCQFRWWDHPGKPGPILELSRGSQSQSNSTHLDAKITGYSYIGGGLGAGVCGVSMQVEGDNVLMVACRVRAKGGGWTYAWAEMNADGRDLLSHTLAPRESVVLPGGEARFMSKAQEPLGVCMFILKDLDLDFKKGAQSNNSTGHYRYLGAGLEGGECGLAIVNVTKEDNGPVVIWVDDVAGTKRIYRYLALIVARRPSFPALIVEQEVNNIKAECIVEASRPPPQLTWLLGDDVIRRDMLDESPAFPQDDWKWPWTQGYFQQNLSLSLEHKENRQVLKCRVSHVALVEPMEVEEIISTIDTSKSPDLSLNVTVSDNGPPTLNAVCTAEGSQPAAIISWYLGGEPVSQSNLQYVPDNRADNVSNPNTTTQTLTRQLSDADIGKELWCVAKRFALSEGKSSLRIKIQVPMCPPVTSETLLISCSLGREKQDCAQHQHIGTVARLSCKPGHLLPYGVIITTTTCMTTAKWDQEIFSCVPECGRRKSNSGSELVANGQDATVGEFPWHVAIYRQPPGVQTPVQICGGSLIRTHLVLSAAHCFYDKFLKKMKDSSEYKVAAGKHLIGWEDSDPSVQKRNVTDIRHKLFGGRDRNFASDIALVYLSEPVEVTPKVNYVCIDWQNVFELWHLRAGSVGVVPGWGYTEKGSQSNELKYIDLPYVPPDVCYNSLSVDLRPILTNDKFCAGYINQSKSVCRGDSGGGLVFLEERADKYYLRGIVSVAFKPAGFGGICYSDEYVGFTLVSQYIPWIQKNLALI